MEIVGASKRIWTGMLIQVFFAIGVCYVALMAYLWKNWRWVNVSVVVPVAIYLSCWW